MSATAPLCSKSASAVHRTAPEGHRVLICAPYGRDSNHLTELLTREGYDALACADIGEVAAHLDEHVGVVLLAEECLTDPLDAVAAWIGVEPAWSNLPFLLLALPQTGRLPRPGAPRQSLAAIVTNLVILERPLGAVSLISAVAAAMRGRQKQFEMRDRLRELAENRQALMASEAELRRAAEALELKVAERTQELREEVASRAQAEAALRQSQKMEALGQLTGGIAHDFNNMLTGVIGSLDLIRRRIASGRLENLDRYMDAASASALRAAALTQRLLAFSRRQSLDSRPIDVNRLIRSLDDLIDRTISEQITLDVVLADDLPHGVADENQLESAILNLVINARDAMPRGGRLTVETSYLEIDEAYASGRAEMSPGRYVVVAVSDTGLGIEPAILEKVFDPFFTTKPLGEGTGLGLSMVYGFARQNGGTVRIHSHPGEGTSVKIYLPAADQAAAEPPHAPEPQIPDGAGQTVLVVEDDPSVRMLVHEVLDELGYKTLVAGEATAAVPILASDQPLDLMISDVGLPGMNGRELAEVAQGHRPDLPILFVTGYAEKAAVRSGFLGANMQMISKPFALDVLAGKICEMLPAGPG